MGIENKKLDNPVWNSLSETHGIHALEYNGIKFYIPEYCPFGGFIKTDNLIRGINQYSALINNFYVVGEKPLFSSLLTLNKNLVCNQMLLEQPTEIEIKDQIVELISEQQKTDLFDLVNLVQPGYFNNKTAELGRYFGIYKKGKLVSVTGERMKMNKFTEISAVVTHPEYTGNGYAKQLIKLTSSEIFNENKRPYLHVAESNIGAIRLYEKLGFVTRRKINFWNFTVN